MYVRFHGVGNYNEGTLGFAPQFPPITGPDNNNNWNTYVNDEGEQEGKWWELKHMPGELQCTFAASRYDPCSDEGGQAGLPAPPHLQPFPVVCGESSHHAGYLNPWMMLKIYDHGEFDLIVGECKWFSGNDFHKVKWSGPTGALGTFIQNPTDPSRGGIDCTNVYYEVRRPGPLNTNGSNNQPIWHSLTCASWHGWLIPNTIFQCWPVEFDIASPAMVRDVKIIQPTGC